MKGSSYYNVNSSDIFGISFFTSNILVLRMSHRICHCCWAIKHALFFSSSKYKQRKIRIYAVVNQVTLHPKEKIYIFVTEGDFTLGGIKVTCLVLLEGFQWVKPWKFAVVISIGQKTKTKKRKKVIKHREKQKFLALGDLMRCTKEVSIEGNSLFLVG